MSSCDCSKCELKRDVERKSEAAIQKARDAEMVRHLINTFTILIEACQKTIAQEHTPSCDAPSVPTYACGCNHLWLDAALKGERP